jgi:hypothetical protein
LRDLFGAMQHGGRLGFERIDWLNGGLFDSNDVLPLESAEIKTRIPLPAYQGAHIRPPRGDSEAMDSSECLEELLEWLR